MKPCTVVNEVSDKQYNDIKDLINSMFILKPKTKNIGIKDIF